MISLNLIRAFVNVEAKTKENTAVKWIKTLFAIAPPTNRGNYNARNTDANTGDVLCAEKVEKGVVPLPLCLVPSWRKPNMLQSLNLSHNPIGDEGAQALATALHALWMGWFEIAEPKLHQYWRCGGQSFIHRRSALLATAQSGRQPNWR